MNWIVRRAILTVRRNAITIVLTTVASVVSLVVSGEVGFSAIARGLAGLLVGVSLAVLIKAVLDYRVDRGKRPRGDCRG